MGGGISIAMSYPTFPLSFLCLSYFPTLPVCLSLVTLLFFCALLFSLHLVTIVSGTLSLSLDLGSNADIVIIVRWALVVLLKWKVKANPKDNENFSCVFSLIILLWFSLTCDFVKTSEGADE